MELQEYYEKIEEINKRSKKEKNILLKQYLDEIKRYDIGDIIKDSTYTIIVERIVNSSYTSDIPKVGYIGTWLTKAMKPNHKEETYMVCESSAILVKKKED